MSVISAPWLGGKIDGVVVKGVEHIRTGFVVIIEVTGRNVASVAVDLVGVSEVVVTGIADNAVPVGCRTTSVTGVNTREGTFYESVAEVWCAVLTIAQGPTVGNVND